MELVELVPQTETEAELIRRILEGAKDDYRELVLAHQSFVFALIMRQIGNQAIANELTQETFLKAYTNLNRFRFEAQFSTWITRIALNVCNSYFSSKKFKQQKNTISIEDSTFEDSAPAEDAKVFDCETRERLKTSLAALSPKLKDAIVLCGFEERSYAEAASILQIPVGTVRSRLNKARNILRKKVFEV